MEKTNKKKEFVAISDFHCYTYPLEKIKKYYVNEFNYVYILGDATDRGEYGDGTGGIELLEEIKELTEKYPERVIYIPGNHDEFIVGYAKGIEVYKCNLIRNGGEKTINDLEKLKENYPDRYYELINWLSKLPIQRVYKYEDKNYVFAHALFNQKIYEYNPNYSLEDYFQEDNRKINKMVDNILWFRKGDVGSYCASELPSSNSIMVIGHTPPKYRTGSLDLEDADGNMIKIQCVDGGIAYDGVMLKYMSGESKPISTQFFIHQSPELEEEQQKDTDERDIKELNNNIVKDIIRLVNNRYTKRGDTTIEKLIIVKEILLRPTLISLYCVNIKLRRYMQDKLVSYEDMFEKISQYKGTEYFEYDSYDYDIQYYDYVKTVLLDYIINVYINLMGVQKTIKHLNSYLYSNPEGIYVDSRNFVKHTKGISKLLARDYTALKIVKLLGIMGIKRVLKLHGCSTIEEYIEEKNKYAIKQNNEKPIVLQKKKI